MLPLKLHILAQKQTQFCHLVTAVGLVPPFIKIPQKKTKKMSNPIITIPENDNIPNGYVQHGNACITTKVFNSLNLGAEHIFSKPPPPASDHQHLQHTLTLPIFQGLPGEEISTGLRPVRYTFGYVWACLHN